LRHFRQHAAKNIRWQDASFKYGSLEQYEKQCTAAATIKIKKNGKGIASG